MTPRLRRDECHICSLQHLPLAMADASDTRPIDVRGPLPPAVSARDLAQWFGKRLTELRLLSGLTIRELADNAGLASGTVSNLLAGGQQPNLRQLLALQRALRVGSLEELLGTHPSLCLPQQLLRARDVPWMA